MFRNIFWLPHSACEVENSWPATIARAVDFNVPLPLRKGFSVMSRSRFRDVIPHAREGIAAAGPSFVFFVTRDEVAAHVADGEFREDI